MAEVNPEDHTREELQAMAAERGQPTSGTKQELADLLNTSGSDRAGAATGASSSVAPGSAINPQNVSPADNMLPDEGTAPGQFAANHIGKRDEDAAVAAAVDRSIDEQREDLHVTGDGLPEGAWQRSLTDPNAAISTNSNRRLRRNADGGWEELDTTDTVAREAPTTGEFAGVISKEAVASDEDHARDDETNARERKATADTKATAGA